MQQVLTAIAELKDIIAGTTEKVASYEQKIEELAKALKAHEERIWKLEKAATPARVSLGDRRVAWDAEQRVEFLRWFQGALTRTLTEGTDAEGGYLVPEEFRPELLRLVEKYGLFRKNARVIPMTREEMKIPKLASGVNVYWPGEGNAITEASADIFGQATLTAKKLAGYITASQELVEDSSLDVVDLIVTVFAEAIAKEEDRVGFKGDSSGTDPFDGVLNASGVNTVTMGSGDTSYSNVSYDDLCDMISAVKSTEGCVWCLHRTVLGVIRKLKDNNGHPIWASASGGDPATILGYPYLVSEVMPSTGDANQADKPFMFFGNLKYALLGDRKKITVGTSEHVKFAEDEIAIKVVERIAINIAVPAAFAVLKTAAS